MRTHRNDDGASARRRANPSPPLGDRVHGLGDSDALRVLFEPVQLPWLADEIDTLRDCVEDDLVRARAGRDQIAAEISDERSPEARAAEEEVDRRAYQLQVLRMICQQVPVSGRVAAACVGSPWDAPSDLGLELAGIAAPVAVVGPGPGMLVLIRGAARNVADALGQALRLSERHAGEHRVGTAMAPWPERHRLTAAVATRLTDLAAAAHAFADNYVDGVRQQAYSFDPEHSPPSADELW